MENQWSGIDLRLTIYGGLFLGVAGICFGIPPIPAILIAFVTLFTLAGAHDKQAKRSPINVLSASMSNKSFDGLIISKYITLRKKLLEDGPKRDYITFSLGYWLLLAAIVFKFIQLCLICNDGRLPILDSYKVPDWLIKGLFGSI